MQNRGIERKALNLLKILDPLGAFLIWMMIYQIRFQFFGGEPGQLQVFLLSGVALAFLVMYSFSREGLYQSRRLDGLGTQMFSLIRAHSIVIAGFVVGLYFLADRRLSRSVILLYALLFLIFQISVRLGLHGWLKKVWASGRDHFQLLFVGDSPFLSRDFKVWQNRDSRGVQVIGWVDDGGQAGTVGLEPFKGDLRSARTALNPDMLVIGYTLEKAPKIQDILRDHHNDLVAIQIVNEIPYSVLGLKAETRSGLPVFTLNQPDFPAVDLLLKRLMDIICTGLALVILSPLLVLLALGVKLSSPGPIFFGQERIGLDGRKFKMWKFRSMRVSAESEATWTTANDPRKTKFGSFLRSTSLDELPQLWNIFSGEMSMVGPRPEQPRYVEKFRHEIPAYMLRHKMKAGLTGWAQVNGWRGDTDLTKRIECDLFYIRNWSLWLDIKIIFLTFFKGFINRNAY